MSRPSSHPFDKKSDPKSPNVRNASVRRGAKDGSLSPTEKLKKSRLMKQFSKVGNKGYEVRSGNSEAFRNNFDAIDWGRK